MRRPWSPILWFKRHWRGELSLGQSYWLSMLLLWVALGTLRITVQSLPHSALRLAALLTVLTNLLIIAGIIWQNVGIWRSAAYAIAARRRQQRRAIWAHVARAMVVLGCLMMAVLVPLVLGPLTWTNLQVAAGIETMGPHTVTLRNHGREIDVSGVIGVGTADEVRRLLASSPDVRTVDLHSRGGRVIEARALRDVIRDHGLATYVATYCASACTIAFLGGEPRILRQGAKLGFHHYFATGLFDMLIPLKDIDERSDFTERDVPADFIDHVFATQGSSIWLPGSDELVSAHVVTQTSSGMALSAAAGDWMNTPAGARAALLGSPAFSALQRRAPDLFEQAVGAAVDAAREDATLGETLARAQVPLVAGFTRFVRVADDATQRAMVRLMQDEGRYLGQGHPTQCAALFGRKGQTGTSYIEALSPALQQRDVAMTGAVIEAGATRPTSAMASQAELVALLRQLGAGRPSRSRTDDVDAATIPDPFCRTMVRVMDGLAVLPPEQLGPMMRRLFAGAG